MKYFISLVLVAMSFNSIAQETITYPYNPDGDVDGTVALPDLLDLLGVYGGDFSPGEIMIDGVGLLQFLQDLQNELGTSNSICESQNLYFPEGIDGEHILIELNGTDYGVGDEYVVPEGKRLYLTSLIGAKLHPYDDNHDANPGGWATKNGPMLINPLDTLRYYIHGEDAPLPTISGLLVDIRPGIEGVSRDVLADQSYTIPDDKDLYIIYHNSDYINTSAGRIKSNSNSSSVPTIITGGNSILSAALGDVSYFNYFSGYLVDKGFFIQPETAVPSTIGTHINNDYTTGYSNEEYTCDYVNSLSFGDVVMNPVTGYRAMVTPGKACGSQIEVPYDYVGYIQGSYVNYGDYLVCFSVNDTMVISNVGNIVGTNTATTVSRISKLDAIGTSDYDPNENYSETIMINYSNGYGPEIVFLPGYVYGLRMGNYQHLLDNNINPDPIFPAHFFSASDVMPSVNNNVNINHLSTWNRVPNNASAGAWTTANAFPRVGQFFYSWPFGQYLKEF